MKYCTVDDDDIDGGVVKVGGVVVVCFGHLQLSTVHLGSLDYQPIGGHVDQQGQHSLLSFESLELARHTRVQSMRSQRPLRLPMGA